MAETSGGEHPVSATRIGELRGEIRQRIPQAKKTLTKSGLEGTPLNRAAINVAGSTYLTDLEHTKEKEKLQKEREEAEQNSFIDPKTGMFNDRAYVVDLKARIDEAKRNRTELLMAVMTDIDDFGPINVIYDQLIGDKVLIEVGKRVHGARAADRSYRVGGEEMVVLMPSIPQEVRKTNGRSHENPGDRIRREIENTDFSTLEGLGRVKEKMTISVGMAEFDHRGDTAETFYTRLSNAAKIAKMLGKNRTVVATLENMGKVKIENYLDLKTGKTYKYTKLFDNPEKPQQFREFLTDNTTSEKFEVVQDEAKKGKPKLISVPQ